MTTDVESRLRAASESLHRSAAAVTADQPPSPRSRVPLVVAMAVSVVVVATVVVVALDRRAGLDRTQVLPVGPTTSTVSPVPGEPAADELLTGRYEDGTWTVYVDRDGLLCGATRSGDRGSSVCTASDERVVTLHDNGGDPVAVFGVMPETAASIRAANSEGLLSAEMSEPGREPRVYVISLHSRIEPPEVTFFDDDGQVVATETVT